MFRAGEDTEKCFNFSSTLRKSIIHYNIIQYVTWGKALTDRC